jgi:hypothetical protein
MEVNQKLADQAIQEGLQKFPEMSSFGPQLVCRPVFGGVTFQVAYETQPPKEQPQAWDFQNAVVRAYKRLIAE